MTRPDIEAEAARRWPHLGSCERMARRRAFVEGWSAALAWRPIETAPTNTSVLVFIPNAEHYGPGIYRAILVDMGTGRRWGTFGLHIGRDPGPECQPTHWLPLPPPPPSGDSA